MGAAIAALDHQTTPYGHHGPDPSCRWGRGSGNTVIERPGSHPEVLGLNCITLSRDSTPKIDRRAPPPTPGMTFYVRRCVHKTHRWSRGRCSERRVLGGSFAEGCCNCTKHNPEPWCDPEPTSPDTPHPGAKQLQQCHTLFQAAGCATARLKTQTFSPTS